MHHEERDSRIEEQTYLPNHIIFWDQHFIMHVFRDGLVDSLPADSTLFADQDEVIIYVPGDYVTGSADDFSDRYRLTLKLEEDWPLVMAVEKTDRLGMTIDAIVLGETVYFKGQPVTVTRTSTDRVQIRRSDGSEFWVNPIMLRESI